MTETIILLHNAEFVTESEKPANRSVLIRNKRISEIFDADRNDTQQKIDLHGLTVFPGFIDVHIHGAIGVDVNVATIDDLRRMARFLAENGTTAWLPTFVPDSDDNYRTVIAAIDELMRTQTGEPIAQAVGVHYEGVFANEKMCGALRPRFFKSFADGDEIEQLPRLENGVHFTTLAPEIENGIELIEKLIGQDWIVSVGHTKADFETLEKAFAAGARHLTHFYNAMTGLHHRDVGVVGWALTKSSATFDIIADGVHVDPRMVEFACRTKSPENVCLISDAVLPTGLGDGEYEVWGEKISVSNGQTRNERGSIAGSVITMLDAVRMMLSLGFSPAEVARMASANPARLLGIGETHGSIEVGKRADLVALDDAGAVKFVMVGGETVINNL